MYKKQTIKLKEIDIIEDKEYILSRLKKAEKSPRVDFETAYRRWLEYIDKLWKNVL